MKIAIKIFEWAMFILMCMITLVNRILKWVVDIITLEWVIKMLGKRGLLDWLDDI